MVGWGGRDALPFTPYHLWQVEEKSLEETEQDNWPCSSPAPALQIVDHAPLLGNTLELVV